MISKTTQTTIINHAQLMIKSNFHQDESINDIMSFIFDTAYGNIAIRAKNHHQ
jgi:hypothetical protein